MLHKSSTYCPRQMSSSSLIFSMGAISMKVNLAFIFIFIIATSLAIHTPVHSYPAITLAIHTHVHSYPAITLALGRSVIRLLSWPSHLLLRCLRPSWGGLYLGSFHGPHIFCLRCLCLSWGGLNLGSYCGPHTLYLRCLHLSSWDGLYLGSYHGPHTFCLRCLRSS